MNKLILTAVALFSISAFADIKPMSSSGREGDAANIATSVYSVQNFKIGNLQFKLTQLDSGLNGDISTTAILAVGQGAIGGAAGYDAAFWITPGADGKYLSVRSAKLVGSTFVFTLMDGNFKPVTKKYRYDEKIQTLVEVK